MSNGRFEDQAKTKGSKLVLEQNILKNYLKTNNFTIIPYQDDFMGEPNPCKKAFWVVFQGLENRLKSVFL
jgi:hypothetical protein